MSDATAEARPERIRIRLSLDGFPRHTEEFVWATPVEAHYRVMSAPFLSDVCCRGDTVEVVGDGAVREFERVIHSGGSETLRFLFSASGTPDEEAGRVAALTAYGAVAEHASNRFYVLDVSLEGNRLAVKAQLEFWQKKGWLLYADDRDALSRIAHALADRPLNHWGFDEPPETPALSVRAIVEGGTLSQHVVRGPEPPKFQLLPWGTPEEDEAQLATLGCLVEQDPTLHGLADLPVGWHAWRESAADPWASGPYEP